MCFREKNSKKKGRKTREKNTRLVSHRRTPVRTADEDDDDDENDGAFARGTPRGNAKRVARLGVRDVQNLEQKIFVDAERGEAIVVDDCERGWIREEGLEVRVRDDERERGSIEMRERGGDERWEF